MASGRCTFCVSETWVRPTDALSVCRSCASWIAHFAERGAADIWDMPAPVASDPTLDDFRAGVAQQIAPEDAETHLNLAQAYAVMGLHADALRAAAVATRGTEPQAKDALRLVLTAPLLRPGGMQKLRKRLGRDRLN